MSEADRIRDRFTGFRGYSTRITMPPGVEAVRRAVRVRRTRRTAYGAVAAMLALLATMLPIWVHRTSLPSVPLPSPSTVPSPSESDSGFPDPVAPAAGGSSTSSAKKPTLACFLGSDGRGDLNPGVYPENGDYYVLPSDYFVKCPRNRIRVYAATWTWDTGRQQLVLYRSSEIYLSAAQPRAKAPVPASAPPGINCGYVQYVVQSGRPVPATIPTSVQDGPERDHFQWIASQGNLLTGLWSIGTTGSLKGVAGCGPSASPTG
jgi:hypothetical protein